PLDDLGDAARAAQVLLQAKNDLATVFLQRCLELCAEGGTASLVLPQNWLFLKSYKKLRERLLKGETLHLLARLGPGAFETISGEVVKAILLNLGRGNSRQQKDRRFTEKTGAGMMYGLDVSELRTASEKAGRLVEAGIEGVEQASQLENPDARVLLQEMFGELLERYASAYQGISTGDNLALKRSFWEQTPSARWDYFFSTVSNTIGFGGMHSVIDLDSGEEMAAVRGIQAWGRCGVAVSQMRGLPTALYLGAKFDTNVSALSVKKTDHLPAIWCFCSSPEYHQAVRRIDQKLNVTNATLAKVPFDLDHWTKVASERYPNGLPHPYSDDPTQWIFHGHPCGSVVWDETIKRTAHGSLRTDPTVLQVAVARLLGYRWPAEQDAEMELADEQREWVQRCEGLIPHADKDGIVCIPSVRGESPAGDRLLALLTAAFGDDWNDGALGKLLAQAGTASLDDYLRNHFFDEHCKLFHHRPFVWHIHDGRRDGFHALVNYHKLAEDGGKGRQLLESLTWSYLGDWITRQRDGERRGEAGADDRLVAALGLQKRLAAILEGEPPFDIFVRWKPLKEQPIGWEPDINDGVRLNIRPFMAEDIPGGKKGAGILRARPNLHWRKDRGKEPLTRGKRSKPPWLDDDAWDPDDDKELRPREEFPWFWRNGEFTGDRVNDLHLTRAHKQRAREEGDPCL
ncbi:MAG: N-6 DNA methylase, partial [Gemmatimonadetes bacterium]|nr:N-6 DNA methylase [Gemmatimonadota bacterium]